MIFTVGHGSRTIGEFIGLLREAGIERLADIRAFPASRRHPQFAREALESMLAGAGIRYAWEGEALGGRRRIAKNSPHVALKNAGFRAYAGHMETPAFRQGLDGLVECGREIPSAILCAERLPWQCHRNLVADSLVARGVPVLHLVAPGQSRQHVLSPLARIEGGRLVYDVGEQLPLEV